MNQLKSLNCIKKDGTVIVKQSYWFFLPAAMLILALLPLPYGFYSFLRLLVPVAAGVAGYRAYQNVGGVNWIVVTCCLTVLLFNPIFPIHLSRPVWLPIDLAAAGLFAYLALDVSGEADDSDRT